MIVNMVFSFLCGVAFTGLLLQRATMRAWRKGFNERKGVYDESFGGGWEDRLIYHDARCKKTSPLAGDPPAGDAKDG